MIRIFLDFFIQIIGICITFIAFYDIYYQS